MRVIARPAFKGADKNPYTALLYSAVRDAGVEVAEYSSCRLLTERWDICHIHWPESLLETGSRFSVEWSACWYRTLLAMARRRGIRLVWTVHNLKPHDLVFPETELGFWRWVLRRVNAIIAMNRTGLTEAVARYPELAGLPHFVVPHGHYRGVYANTIDRRAARERLKVADEATVISFFGQIRTYKNVPELVSAFRALADPSLVLFIAGSTSKRAPGLDDTVRKAAEGDPRIRLEMRFIGNDDVQLYLNAADLVVLPYEDILNSGAAMLALSFDRPVLVPDLGAMAELQTNLGSSWVRTYHGPLNASILTEALAWARQAERPPTAPLQAFDWPAIAAQVIAAYRAVCDAPVRRDLSAGERLLV